MIKRLVGTSAVSALLVLQALAAFGHGPEMLLGSTASGSGMLALSYEFSDKVVVTPSVTIAGMTLYTSIIPGIEWLQEDQPPEFALKVGTPFSMQIVSIVPAGSMGQGAAVVISGTTLSQPGQSAFVANTTNVAGDHFHPQWQLLLPNGVMADYMVSFKLTTTSPSYTASATYTLVLTNIPEPTATPTATDTPTAMQSTATPTPLQSPATPVPPSACPPTPLGGCRQPGATKASLLIKNDPSDSTKNKVVWKWLKGDVTPKSAFGDPVPADYTFCVYAGAFQSVVVEASISGGGTCPSCWTETGSGFKYDVSTVGIQKVILKSGDVQGKAKIILKGKDSPPTLPNIPLTQPVLAQLSNSDGECWEAAYSDPPKKNEGKLFKDKSD